MQLQDLLSPIVPVDHQVTCAAVYDRFASDSDLMALPVVREGEPIGLVDRHQLLMRLSHQFGHSLYSRKPISELMDAEPLIVDVRSQLSTLNRIVTLERPSAVLKGFIVTDDGHYLGVGTGLALLQATNDEMAAHSAALERARHGLEQANRAKSEFLANMSHELRTPLNAILGFSDLMARQALGPIGTPAYIGYLRDIHDSGAHLLALINDVLDMARFEAGRLELNEADVALDDVIQRSIRMIQGRADEQGVSIVTEVDGALPWLLGDAVKLQQVVVNLLSNAVKFTPAGGTVTVAGHRTGPDLTMTVCDTGVGIPRHKLEHVLEPFVQGDVGPARRHEGVGLGLPLSRSLIELHGGRLTLDSSPGRGTTVTVLLPGERLLDGIAAAG